MKSAVAFWWSTTFSIYTLSYIYRYILY